MNVLRFGRANNSLELIRGYPNTVTATQPKLAQTVPASCLPCTHTHTHVLHIYTCCDAFVLKSCNIACCMLHIVASSLHITISKRSTLGRTLARKFRYEVFGAIIATLSVMTYLCRSHHDSVLACRLLRVKTTDRNCHKWTGMSTVITHRHPHSRPLPVACSHPHQIARTQLRCG